MIGLMKMIRGRRVLTIAVFVAVFTVSASANIINQPFYAEIPACSNSSYSQDSSSITDSFFELEFDLGQVRSLPVVADTQPEPQSISLQSQPLSDGTNSLSLCLSALIGFGVISSVRHIKSINLGFIPDWYHDGGPDQIGHSFAIAPDCICNMQNLCFVQPDNIEDYSLLPQYHIFICENERDPNVHGLPL